MNDRLSLLNVIIISVSVFPIPVPPFKPPKSSFFYYSAIFAWLRLNLWKIAVFLQVLSKLRFGH